MKWLLAFALVVSAMASDINGKWKAKFDTQIGEQHYTYQFKADGDKLTGTATNDMGTTEIKGGTIKGEVIYFVENIEFNGMAIRIEYSGKMAGDEIKFTRKVGDFATEDLVAKREK
jgi:hypothetical protein